MVLAEADLHRAIAENEIRPAFQPLIELRTEDFPLTRTLLRGETVGAQRFQLTRDGGRQVTLEISSKPIFANDGSLVGAVMIVLDLRSGG